MEIAKRSYFKDEADDKTWMETWVKKLEDLNDKVYSKQVIQTSLGRTQVYGLNAGKKELESLVIFPGARTSALFFDLDNGLKILQDNFRIFMVETNGLPNLSDGNTPDIKSLGYGKWAAEVIDQLQLQSTYIAGASFGALVCMKLGMVSPSKIKAAFILNPGCLQPFSLSLKNLYYNLLPILIPTEKNVRKFLEMAVLYKPNHWLAGERMQLLVDYEVFALNKYKDNTQKPYYMNEELKEVRCPTYLIEGDKDLLFPYERSIKNAKEKINTLKDIVLLTNVGHGIETHPRAIAAIKVKMEQHSSH